MDSKLFFAKLLSEGMVIPDDCEYVYLCTCDVTFYDEDNEYISYYDFDNEQIAYDEYTYQIQGDREFSIKEFNEWQNENPNALIELQNRVREGVLKLSNISSEIEELVKLGQSISNETGAPFLLNINNTKFDIRKISHVEWDSSSMYC